MVIGDWPRRWAWLKGEKPAELLKVPAEPIEPTINMKTAKALASASSWRAGIADEVIE